MDIFELIKGFIIMTTKKVANIIPKDPKNLMRSTKTFPKFPEKIYIFFVHMKIILLVV